jgi:hypothetical protein
MIRLRVNLECGEDRRFGILARHFSQQVRAQRRDVK